MNKKTKKTNLQTDDHKTLWLRTLADFENFKKRTSNEKASWTSEAKIDLLSKILPLLDNLALLATHKPAELEDNAWAKGVDLIAKQIEQTLEDEGISVIAPIQGEVFDPNFHEAISIEKSDLGEGLIVKAHKNGYKINDKIIRPAQVVTSQGK